MCKISSLFEIVNMGILACEICPNLTFLDPGPTLGPTYLIIVGQIHVKLFSTQAYCCNQLQPLWIFPYEVIAH